LWYQALPRIRTDPAPEGALELFRHVLNAACPQTPARLRTRQEGIGQALRAVCPREPRAGFELGACH